MEKTKIVLRVGTLIDSKNPNPSSDVLIFITNDRISEILQFNEETNKLVTEDYKLIDLKDFYIDWSIE